MVFHDDEVRPEADAPSPPGTGQPGRPSGDERGAPGCVGTRLGRVSDPLADPPEQFSTGLPSLDEALGGGLTKGACYFLPGPPGSGKSTVAMEVAGSVAAQGRATVYVSTERTRRAVHQDAVRLGVSEGMRFDGCDSLQDVADILEVVDAVRPSLLVVDSLQSATRRASTKGDLARWADVMKDLCAFARSRDVTVVAVSQVTKDGDYSGSRALEHDSDVFIKLEWDELPGIRVMTVGKNRFGPSGGQVRFGIGRAGIETVDGFLDSLASPHPEELPLFEPDDDQ